MRPLNEQTAKKLTKIRNQLKNKKLKAPDLINICKFKRSTFYRVIKKGIQHNWLTFEICRKNPKKKTNKKI